MKTKNLNDIGAGFCVNSSAKIAHICIFSKKTKNELHEVRERERETKNSMTSS